MRVVTEGSIDISESLAAFMLASYIYNIQNFDPYLEKRMEYVTTAKYTISDIYHREVDTAIEVKSKEHGNAALKGVLQASVYKEQADNSILCMQIPNREPLAKGILRFAEAHGVGVIWIRAIPDICSEDTIISATGGCNNPFKIWSRNRYSTTRDAIIERSRSNWAEDYINTLEEVIIEYNEEIFDFALKPDDSVPGFCDLY